MCYSDKGSLPQSVRWWWEQLKHLCERCTSSAGKNGPVGVLNSVYHTMPCLPLSKQIFCYICFKLAWPGIPLVYIVLLFLLFWSLIGFARLLIILSSQKECVIFIYSVLLPVHTLILGMLSICYLFWKVGHQLLLSLPLS